MYLIVGIDNSQDLCNLCSYCLNSLTYRVTSLMPYVNLKMAGNMEKTWKLESMRAKLNCNSILMFNCRYRKGWFPSHYVQQVLPTPEPQ